MRYIDFHTHITPEIDDGAKTVDESFKMLKVAYAAGAETVILTPHYREKFSIWEFCALRDQKIEMLKESCKKNANEIPNILAGAEVLLNRPLSEEKDLAKLCMEGTDVLLLELPYTDWNKWHFQEVYNIISRHGLMPVLAHIERYLDRPKDLAKIDQLVSIGAKFQVNVNSYLSFSGKRVIKALAKEGLISALGSDCHNLTTRTPDISKAMQSLVKTFGRSYVDSIYRESSMLLNI